MRLRAMITIISRILINMLKHLTIGVLVHTITINHLYISINIALLNIYYEKFTKISAC